MGKQTSSVINTVMMWHPFAKLHETTLCISVTNLATTHFDIHADVRCKKFCSNQIDSDSDIKFQ